MKTEKALQNYLKRECKKAGILYYKFSSPAKRGVPDIIMVGLDGETYFIEMKTPAGTGKLSALQNREIKILREQGANVYVLYTKMGVDGLVKILKSKVVVC